MGVWSYFLGVSGYGQEAVGGARNKVNIRKYIENS